MVKSDITLYNKRCDHIKDLERGSLSWVIWVSLICNYMHPYKRKAEKVCRPNTQKRSHIEEKETIQPEARDGMMRPHAKELPDLPEAGRGKEWILL